MLGNRGAAALSLAGILARTIVLGRFAAALAFAFVVPLTDMLGRLFLRDCTGRGDAGTDTGDGSAQSCAKFPSGHHLSLSCLHPGFQKSQRHCGIVSGPSADGIRARRQAGNAG